MKNFDFKTLLILALLLVILFMKMFSPKPKPTGEIIKIDGKKYEVIKKVVDTQYIPQTKVVFKKGKDIYHDSTIYVEVPVTEKVDTNLLLKNYFAQNIFKDTLKLNDSLGFVSIIDTISQNKIYSRKWNSNVIKTFVEQKTIVKEYKTVYYLGGVIGFDKPNIINFAGPSLLIKNKKENVISIGAGYSNSKSFTVQGGFHIRLN
jgi:hypothetical protein